jgi:serine/threonine protein kinase
LNKLIDEHLKMNKKISRWVFMFSWYFNFFQYFKNVEEILLSLLMGVYTLHFEGIIHRDIKPLNIFFSDKLDSLSFQLGMNYSFKYFF